MKNGGGEALIPRPLVSGPQKILLFSSSGSAGNFQPRNAPLPRAFFVGKLPQSGGAGGSGIWGETPPPLPPPPISQEQANRPWPSAGSGPGVPPPSPGGAGGSRARWALRPRGRSQPPLGCRGPGVPTAEGGGGQEAHPTVSKEKASSPPHPPRIKEGKKIKTQPRKRLGVFSPPPLPVSYMGPKPPKPPWLLLDAPPQNPQPTRATAPACCRAGSLSTHHLLFIGKSEWSHFVAYASRLYL